MSGTAVYRVLICLLSVGNSFKTCITSVDIGKAFNQIDRGHIKVPQISFDTLDTLVTRPYRFYKLLFKCVTRSDFSGFPFNVE